MHPAAAGGGGRAAGVAGGGGRRGRGRDPGAGRAAARRRLSRRLGGNKAKCAVGRSVLVIIWHLLASPEARFTDLGPRWHDNHGAGRDRKVRNHLRQLRALGLEVTVTPAA